MSVFRRPGAASRLALAIALSSATALAVATPAQAAKKQEQEQAQGAKADLSKEFAAAYTPYFQVVKAKGDVTTVKDSLPAIQAAAKTADDKFTAGQATYSIGLKLNDVAMQRQGVDMMVDSGSKLGAGEQGNLLFGAARLAYDAKDWATARARAQQAVAAGYSGDVDLLLAETYFGENQAAAGLDLLDKAVAKKVAAGETVPDSWLKRGLAIAAKAQLEPQSAKFAGLYAQYYPSAASWGDAIAIQRNFNNYDGQDLLDLMRLAQRTNSLRSERDYVDYISAADARRLPGETQRIIKEGIAAGKLRAGDVFVTEANTISSGRVQADLADLPKLANDARGGGATVATLMAAGDAFLSYQKPAEAEQFYTLALAKPGVDTARVLTRLGIAQADQGKSAEAAATFAKVTGPRQPIAQLWTLYVKQAKTPAAQ
jgi:hypothetical protein